MKRIFLLSFTTLLFINNFSGGIDHSVSAQSFSEQIETEESMKKISPTGAWFTEDDELP